MQKQLAFLLLSLLLGQTAGASPISKSAARQVAVQFATERGITLATRSVRRAPGINTEQDQQPYYIYNASDNRGFVVVSGDDSTVPVLGYATKGQAGNGLSAA